MKKDFHSQILVVTIAYGLEAFLVTKYTGRITYWFIDFNDHFYLALMSLALIAAIAIGFYEMLIRL